MSKNLDENFMREAMILANKGLFSTSPNPRVGCVVVKNSKIVGKGFHLIAGGDHAEILAIKDAGSAVKGSSLYITLEPCNSIGRTGPCVDELIKSGVRRVIVAMRDPNPKVNGTGIKSLEEAGIEVTCGVLESEAIELNLGFIKRMRYGLPWVRVKSAISMDGFTAIPTGESKWITNQPARDDGHKWRARACMVMTGIGTLKKDNPQLNVRSIKTLRQPTKILIDTNLESDFKSSFFTSGNIIIFCSEHPTKLDCRKETLSKEKNIEIIKVKEDLYRDGRINLKSSLVELASRECNELHLEAGPSLTGSFMKENLIDEWLIYVAPTFLERGLTIFESNTQFTSLSESSKWSFKDVSKIGEDLRIILRPKKFNSNVFFNQEIKKNV